jgi:hypothetical protein
MSPAERIEVGEVTEEEAVARGVRGAMSGDGAPRAMVVVEEPAAYRGRGTVPRHEAAVPHALQRPGFYDCDANCKPHCCF